MKYFQIIRLIRYLIWLLVAILYFLFINLDSALLIHKLTELLIDLESNPVNHMEEIEYWRNSDEELELIRVAEPINIQDQIIDSSKNKWSKVINFLGGSISIGILIKLIIYS
jgi:hypothetical protein